MRTNYFLTSTLAVATMLVTSCSTPQLAQNASGDDVYNTTAQARVYKPAPPVQASRVDTSRYEDSRYTSSDPNYDMDYQSRIDRFYYGNNYRPYYDDYYNYYGYNSWYNPYDVSLGFHYGFGYNNWYNPFNSWAYFGSPYRWNTWGPYSYYSPWYNNYYPWYGGGWNAGYWGGGHWGGGNVIVRNDNYKPRPTRGYNGGTTAGNGRGTNIGYTPSRGVGEANMGRPTRPQAYNPATNGGSATRNTNTSGRPTRGNSVERPAPTSNTPVREPSRPSYSPPANSGGSNNSGGSSSGSSGGSSRPTRSGGRG